MVNMLTLSAWGQDSILSIKDTILTDSIEINDSLTVLNPITTELKVAGKVYPAIITESGDTLILADLDDVSITSFRTFKSEDDRRKYEKYRRYAIKVFPYAREAIRIFREVEYASEHLSKKEKKKRIKELQKELKAEFEDPLSKLTKLQGKILIKMIEKETNKTMYNCIKELRGRFTAFYWHNFSKLYSYNLKEGYEVGKYEILDAVLQDFDISYRIEYDSTMKYIKINQ